MSLFSAAGSTDATLQHSSSARSGSSVWTGPLRTHPGWRTCLPWPIMRGVSEATPTTKTSMFIYVDQVHMPATTQKLKKRLIFGIVLHIYTLPLHCVCVCRGPCASQNGIGGQEDGLWHTERLESVRHQLQLQVCHWEFPIDGMVPLSRRRSWWLFRKWMLSGGIYEGCDTEWGCRHKVFRLNRLHEEGLVYVLAPLCTACQHSDGKYV